jgi:hypothetical protein
MAVLAVVHVAERGLRCIFSIVRRRASNFHDLASKCSIRSHVRLASREYWEMPTKRGTLPCRRLTNARARVEPEERPRPRGSGRSAAVDSSTGCGRQNTQGPDQRLEAG